VSGGWKYPVASIPILTTTLRWRDPINFIVTSMLIVAPLKCCCQQQSGRHSWNWISLVSEHSRNFSVRCWIRLLLHVKVKVKVNCTLVQALRLCTGRTAHRGSTGIALLFLDHCTRRGWGVNVTPWPLFTPGKTRYQLYRRMGGPQGRSGQVRKISSPPGFDPGPSSP